MMKIYIPDWAEWTDSLVAVLASDVFNQQETKNWAMLAANGDGLGSGDHVTRIPHDLTAEWSSVLIYKEIRK